MEYHVDRLDDVPVIRTTHRGQDLHWPTSTVWNNLQRAGTQAVFGPLNEFLQTVPMTAQDGMFTKLIEAHDVLNDFTSMEISMAKLTAIVTGLVDLVNHDHLTRWMTEYGRIAYNNDIHETYVSDYPRRQTYIRAEYDELVALSVYYKLITPIWGRLLSTAAVYNSGYKEMIAYSLVDGSRIPHLPAALRFSDYCEALVEKDSEALTPAICTMIGTSEIPRLFLSVAAVCRLSVGEIRSSEKTLIKEAYRYLESKIRSLSNGVQDKRGGRNDGEEPDSVAERLRVSQRIPDYAVVCMSEYAMSIAHFVKKLNPEGSIEKAELYTKMIGKNAMFTIGPYHLPIIAMVTHKHVYPRSARLMLREPFIPLIGITAAWLSDSGRQPLANLLLSPRTDKDPDDQASFSLSGYAIAPLSKHNREALEQLYPYQQIDVQGKSTGNPGIRTIEAIVHQVNQYNWPTMTTVPTNLQNDLAELMLQTLS